MTENPSGPDDYYGIRIAAGENLVDRFPQVAVRARLYRLEDDGASDLARRKRAAKDSAANSRMAIAAIEKRQAGNGKYPPMDQEKADRMIAGHRKRIAEHEQGLKPAGPDVNVVAPVARRVAREDRRRARKQRD
ncbi:hypothetical protein [Arthrobacter sp. UYCo732]|uniref:hypothetical protein n=1 Tax=Arthrobacter sp. UYCo732 TaxID=3156336 RepID=UPI003394C9C6